MPLNDEGAQDVADCQEDESTSSARGRSKWFVAVAAAAVVAGIAAGGVAFANVMGGGGAQPEDVLPASAIAFTKLDLNPSAGQKLAAFRLVSKFPSVRNQVTSEDASIKESMFGSTFTGPSGDVGFGLDYKKDVEPWLGDRIGLGVFPDMDADNKPEVGVAIAFTDRDAAKVALDKAVAKEHAAAEGPDGATAPKTTGYAFTDEYVIVSDTAAHATAIAKAGRDSTLSTSQYAEDVKKLGTDQIGVAWADMAAVYKAVPKDQLDGASLGLLKGAQDPKNISGRIVMGLHADPSFLEVTGKGIAVKGANALVTPSDPKGVGMIASFPSDELGAVTLTGLGKIAGAFYTSFTKTGDPMGLRLVLAGMGIDSATQIETLLGAETGVVVGGTKDVPQLAVRVRSGDPDGAYELARRVLDAAQLDTEVVTVRKVTGPDGIVFGTRPADNTFDLTGAISSGYGSRLGSTEAFRQVMPDVSKATFATYVNLDKVLPLLHATRSKYVPSLKPLDALGVTVTAGAEPTLRLRLSVR